jgi:hypothetical protein
VKLRIEGSSLRLRLQNDEVAALVERGRVEERASFGGDGALVYAVALGDTAGAELGVQYRPGAVTLVVSPERARTWAQSEELGLEAEVQYAEESLRLVVEKDLPCRHGGS